MTQSPIGSVDPTVTANRGCLSQNGSHCLSLQGVAYPDILRFYYGSDIQLTAASGACVVQPISPDAYVPPPEQDTGVPPGPGEDGFSMRPDAGGIGPLPASDAGPRLDGVIPLPGKVEEGVVPVTSPEGGEATSQLRGSCSVPGGSPGPGSLLIVLLLLLQVRRSRSRPGTRR